MKLLGCVISSVTVVFRLSNQNAFTQTVNFEK